MIKNRLLPLLCLFIFLFPFVFAVDIELPSSNNLPSGSELQQAQQFIQEFGIIREQIASLSLHIDERTNLLGEYVNQKLIAMQSSFVVLLILTNICTAGVCLGIILFLKARRLL